VREARRFPYAPSSLPFSLWTAVTYIYIYIYILHVYFGCESSNIESFLLAKLSQVIVGRLYVFGFLRNLIMFILGKSLPTFSY
jgi:hypothetical protein